jgi:broad-specificity NMP kinase
MTPGEAKSTICHKLKNNNYNINNDNDFMCSQFDKSSNSRYDLRRTGALMNFDTNFDVEFFGIQD